MLVIELLFGLALLAVGGEALVAGSVAIARRLGVSRLVIGLTLVGFGTSTPELIASLDAALIGSPGIALGNVVGSNIANILLILGLTALVLPIAITKQAFVRDGCVLVGAAILLLIVALHGNMDRLVGIGFVLLLIAYVAITYLTERHRRSAAAFVHEAEADAVPFGLSFRIGLLVATGGIVAVVAGANILVPAAMQIARFAGIPEVVIGLTMVAVGTSLPELATSIVAAIRGQGDVAFGNIVGSNIFNILGVAGATAIVVPLPVSQQIVSFDIWAMLAATLLLMLLAASGWRVSRREGVLFLVAYAGYLVVQFSPAVRGYLGLS